MLTEFINDLKNSEMGQALLRKHRDNRHQERVTLRQELEAAELERVADAETQAKTLRPLLRAHDVSKAKYLADDAKLREAQRAASQSRLTIDSRLTRLRNQLYATADPRIEAAREAMDGRYDATRNTLSRTQEVRDGNPGERRLIGNGLAIKRLVSAMMSARGAFGRLKLEAPDDVEIAIAAILAPVEAAWDRLAELDEPIGKNDPAA